MAGPPALALTMGEPAGIGPEIAMKAWLRRTAHDLPPFVFLGDARHLKDIADRHGWAMPVVEVASMAAGAARFPDAFPVLPVPLAEPAEQARPNARNAPAVIAAIEQGVALVRSGEARALVTNPIHKAALYSAGFTWPGHTEFLGHLDGLAAAPVMMLACPALRVVPVTIHMSLRRALDALTMAEIIRQSRIVHDALRRDFGLAQPRLALAGLNPHAGEDGAMGDEETTLIRPAIAALAAAGITAAGPMPPDTMFAAHVRGGYDAAICMYHDQALIPIKTLDFAGGTNITLGLSFIRTSPDHGTAFDIAGSGSADPSSLIAALHQAESMAGHRAAFGAT